MPLNSNDPVATQNAITQLGAAGSDKNIDDITKQQISQGLDQFYNGDYGKGKGVFDYNDWGQRSSIISNLYDILQSADAGKGVYGVRMINQNQKNMVAAMPGRAALLSSKYGQGSAGSGGTLGGGTGANANGTSPSGSKSLGSFF